MKLACTLSCPTCGGDRFSTVNAGGPLWGGLETKAVWRCCDCGAEWLTTIHIHLVTPGRRTNGQASRHAQPVNPAEGDRYAEHVLNLVAAIREKVA